MNIYDFTMQILEDYFASYGENTAKAKILFKSLYKDKIHSFSEVSQISQRVQDKLSDDFEFTKLKLIEKCETDDTCKFLFELYDHSTVETVLMKHNYGNGVCISTQVGCNMDCAFCESGKLKKKRNLEVWEMIGQLLYISDTLGMQISHVVLMGIGEPFDNFDNVMNLVDIITNQSGLAIASRHVTISTAGIVPRIIDYADRTMAGSLAISLHAPNDELRNTLMPINKAYPLCDLIAAAKLYSEKTRKKVTFAYIMIKDINDTDECATQLAELISGINCYVNLIPCNKTHSATFEPSDKERIASFFDILKKHNINVTVRREFGGDVNAACGQLSSKYQGK